jgi:predicted phosphodiesterase
MRWLVMSDVHGNLVALQSVLRHAESVDRVICLGDVVGYGPRPNECCEVVRELRTICLAGNHDLRIAAGEVRRLESADAQTAAAWTARQLTAANRDFLQSLPIMREHELGLLMHGSPESVEQYLFEEQAATVFGRHSFDLGYFGHVHTPCVFTCRKESRNGPLPRPLYTPGVQTRKARYPIGPLSAAHRYLCNPGSVGQPRDWDPRAAYVIHDQTTDRVTLYRVEYDVGQVQRDMRAQGLPVDLALRLSGGR